jgi:SMODS and SLOG-associating 2TM effector domain 1/Protein of unknown function (DUF4231)
MNVVDSQVTSTTEAPTVGTSNSRTDEMIADLWQTRLKWSAAADKLKFRISFSRSATAILSALGAILETAAATFLSGQTAAQTACAAIGAVFLTVATFVTSRLVTPETLLAWTRTRSVSETFKAEIFTFRAGAAPYDGADASDKLLEKITAVLKDVETLQGYLANVKIKHSAPPPALDHDGYIKDRVEQQIKKYYEKNADKFAGRQQTLRAVEFLMALAATILGALATYFTARGPTPSAAAVASDPSTMSAWVAVFTTLAAALTSHMAANRYDFLVMSYTGTAQRLRELILHWKNHQPQTTVGWSEFVEACEEAISIENQSWMAKWSGKDGAP